MSLTPEVCSNHAAPSVNSELNKGLGSFSLVSELLSQVTGDVLPRLEKLI